VILPRLQMFSRAKLSYVKDIPEVIFEIIFIKTKFFSSKQQGDNWCLISSWL
jgi:hypothetical protein